jgi:RNA polymerase sigma-70 factor (ECF subfamily)
MAFAPIEDAELELLVQKAQEGDRDAFGRIYDRFFLPIYRYAAFRLPEGEAEDAVADVFVKAWEKIHLYKVQRNVPFGAWLFRIARYTIIDTYRRERGFEEVSETLPDPDALNGADYQTRQQDILRIVREALGKLPRRYREILILSYVSELSHREVAKVLRLTEGAVRILKLRALRKMEKLLPQGINETA